MIQIIDFGTVKYGPAKGGKASLYRIVSASGKFALTVSDYGATVINAELYDAQGKAHSLVKGYDTLDFYERAPGYLGAVVGRVGNRLRKGKFTLEGKEYSLFINNNGNHLHGGEFGFNKKLYNAECDDRSVTFSALSPDGDEACPGNLEYSVKYTVSDKGFSIEYFAETDAPTPVNLTNHSYFCFDNADSVEDYVFTCAADRYIPTDSTLIPTGEIKSVKGTVFDFRAPKKLAEAIESDDADIKTGLGLDHCLVFSQGYRAYTLKAQLKDPSTGIFLDYYTDMPAVQVYSGNYLNEKEFPFREGKAQAVHSALCLESENLIDAPNHEGFGNIILRPGEKLYSKTAYLFGFSK